MEPEFEQLLALVAGQPESGEAVAIGQVMAELLERYRPCDQAKRGAEPAPVLSTLPAEYWRAVEAA